MTLSAPVEPDMTRPLAGSLRSSNCELWTSLSTMASRFSGGGLSGSSSMVVRLGAVRAPFGATSAGTIVWARRRGLAVVGWSCWGCDWSRRVTGASVARRVEAGLDPGAIVLLHDSDAYAAEECFLATAAALPAIATATRQRSLMPVTLGRAHQTGSAEAAHAFAGRRL